MGRSASFSNTCSGEVCLILVLAERLEVTETPAEEITREFANEPSLMITTLVPLRPVVPIEKSPETFCNFQLEPPSVSVKVMTELALLISSGKRGMLVPIPTLPLAVLVVKPPVLVIVPLLVMPPAVVKPPFTKVKCPASDSVILSA